MYHMIINPASRSGRGKKIWETLVPILEQKNIAFQPYFTTGRGDAISHTAAITGDTHGETVCLIVLGGDGTMNEVLQGIQDFAHTVIAYIPTGSSNDLARDLGMPHDPVQALLHILDSPPPIVMDIGRIDYESPDGKAPWKVRFFNVGAGIGFDAAVCEEAERSALKNALNRVGLGKLTYLGIALKQLIAAKTVSCNITLDGERTMHLPKFLFIAAMVHRYEGGGFQFCPHASYTDGLLDICIAGPMSKLKLLCILPTAFFGKHAAFQNVFLLRAQNIRIQASAPLWVHTDGEVETKADCIFVTCLQSKVKFII